MSKEIHIEQIKNYIVSKSTRIFSNSNKELFKLLLKNVFENSIKINWFITNLDKIKFFINDEGLLLIENFLKNGHQLNIICKESSENLILKFEKLSIQYDNFTFIQKQNILNTQDILTWDNIGYRFSPEPNRLTGVACANDPEFTKKCDLIFEKILRP